MVKFKKQRDKDRYLHLHPVALMIMFSMHVWAEKRNLPFVVTETLTTKEEDGQVGRKHATHRQGRAFDLSVRGWTIDNIKEFSADFSEVYKEHAALSSADLQPRLVVYHVGTGPHLHVQIHPRYVNEN